MGKSFRPEIERLAKEIKAEGNTMLPPEHLLNIGMAVNSVKHLDGDMAEVGTWKGGSSKLIHLVGGKRVFSFDTFEGHPKPSNLDTSSQPEFRHKTDVEGVREYLKDYEDIIIYKGIFPANSDLIDERDFSFVHIDVNLYQGTIDSLKFFYPRMLKGGIIMLDNYPGIKGVKIAINEFLDALPEKDAPIFEQLERRQAQITK